MLPAQLLQNFDDSVVVSQELKQRLELTVRTKTVKKGDYLVVRGQVCEYVYFVVSGLFRSYIMDDNETEIVTWFAADQDVMTSASSFFFGVFTQEYIQALDDSYVHCISKQDLDDIYQTFVEFNFAGRRFMEKCFVAAEGRNLLLRRSGEDRVRFFLSKYIHLQQRISHKNIASYLGISREHFSRILSKLLREKDFHIKRKKSDVMIM